MTKQHKKLRKKILRYVDKWSWIVTCYGWKLDIYWYTTFKDLGKQDRKKHGKNVAAFIDADFQYLKGVMSILLDRFENMSDEEIERVIVHELTHFLIAPLQQNYDNLEYTTETVSRILYSLGKKE